MIDPFLLGPVRLSPTALELLKDVLRQKAASPYRYVGRSVSTCKRERARLRAVSACAGAYHS